MGKTQSLEIESPLRCKLLIMGAPAVGKTSIVRSLGLKFSEEYEPTLGCELTVNQTYMKGKPVKLICMDSLTETDLHLKFRLKTIKNCDIAMFVFDLSNKKSLAALKTNFKLLKENRYRNKHIILAGNKADTKPKQITSQDIQQFIQSESDIELKYHEISAKSRQNLNDLFNDILQYGIPPANLRWLKLRYIIFLRDRMPKEELYNESWLNFCEVLPNLIKKKTQVKQFPLYKLPPAIIIKLSNYL